MVEMPAGPKVFLTRPITKLGDTVVLTTIFVELLRSYPELRLTCIGGEVMRWASSLLPDRFELLPVKHPKTTEADIVLEFGKAKLSTLLQVRRLKPQKFVAEQRGLLSRFATHQVARGRPRTLHQLELWGEYFRVAFPELPILTEYTDFRGLINSPAPSRNFIAIHTHTGGSNRLPSLETYDQLITVGERLGHKVVLIGGPGCGLASEIAQRHPQASAVVPANIAELGELVYNASLVVSPDTGPAHLAAAMRTPVLDLFCKHYVPTERWHPKAPNVILIRSETACASCVKRGRCYRRDFPDETCTTSFNMSAISAAIRELAQTQNSEPATGLLR